MTTASLPSTRSAEPRHGDCAPVDAAERFLWQQVAEYRANGSAVEFNEQQMQAIVADRGVDFATALLYEQVRSSPRYRDAIAAIDQTCTTTQSAKPLPSAAVRVAIVPGFLHREYPASGADGRMLSEAARRIGWKCETIPVGSTGRLQRNAETILDWLRCRAHDEPVVLASISKGGSDVAAALQHQEHVDDFRRVIGWVSVCGIVRGSPVVDRVLSRWWRRLGLRLLFAARRWSLGAVQDLRYWGGPLEQAIHAPAQMRIVHAVGFPLRSHFTHSRLCAFHQLISDLGPNDGAISLLDLLHAPGVVYPVWGADHYMRPRFRTQPLCEALLRYAAGGLEGTNG